MTMNEEALIERLIVEAAKRGAVEVQLERAVKAAEEAASIMVNDKNVIRKLTEQVERLTETDAKREITEQKALYFLRGLSDALLDYVEAGMKTKKGSAARIKLLTSLLEANQPVRVFLTNYVPF